MAFSKAKPEGFSDTFFNGSQDSDENKKPGVFIDRVSIAQLLAKQNVLFLSCHMGNCKILHAAAHCASLHPTII